jgi:hypothetical protein
MTPVNPKGIAVNPKGIEPAIGPLIPLACREEC